MKIIHILAVLFITIMLCNGCKKDDQRTLEPLPYFYCKINGQNFAARGGGNCQPRTFNYYPNGFMGPDSGYVLLSGLDCKTFNHVGIRIYSFMLTLDTMNFLQSMNYDSVSPFFAFDDKNLSQILVIDSLMSGNIHFTSFSDRQGDQNGIVSGTFEFTVSDTDIDSIIVITEGRFQYIIDYEWY